MRYKRFKRHTNWRRNTATKSVSKAVKSYVKKKLAHKGELKFYEHLLSTSNLQTIANVWSEQEIAGNIAIGTAKYNRIGQEINVEKIEITGVLENAYSYAAGDDYNWVRLILGHYSTAGAATPLTTAVFNESSSLDYVNCPTLLAGYHDKEVIFNPAYTQIGAGGVYFGGPCLKKVVMTYKFKTPLRIKYSAGAGGNLNQTSLVLSGISDSAAPPHCGFTHGRYTLYYRDV